VENRKYLLLIVRTKCVKSSNLHAPLFLYSPVIIAPDANIKTAANRILWGKYYNGGQVIDEIRNMGGLGHKI
jgi:hypothetical protein